MVWYGTAAVVAMGSTVGGGMGRNRVICVV